MDQHKISRCVELICEKGCVQVTATIQMLETAISMPEMAELIDMERDAVLQELKAIMAVYEGKQR